MLSQLLPVLILLCASLLLASCKKDPLSPDEKVRVMLATRSLGLAYLEENQLKESEREFKKLIEIAPKEPIGYANLALTYLRMGNYGEAETQVRKAMEYSNDPEVFLILAETLERSGNPAAAIQELQKSVAIYPRHVPSQYKLAQLFGRSSAADRNKKVETALLAIVSDVPANLPARLQLAETLTKNQKAFEAIVQLREVRQIAVDIPKDSEAYFNQALNSLMASNTVEALPAIVAFHNFLKPTPLYQPGVIELSGPGGPLMGFPLLHFSARFSKETFSAPLKYLRWTELDKKKLTSQEGVPVDWNNDGKMDSYRITEKSVVLSDHSGKVWEELPGAFTNAITFDMDQDGDLDLYTIGDARVLRNNGDGTFEDKTEVMQLQRAVPSTDAEFGDFDDDGDLDLLVSDTKEMVLYDNLRQGRFQDITKRSGLSGAAQALAVTDYDSNGLVDIFAIGQDSILFRNKGFGTFVNDERSPDIGGNQGQTAVFFDFDNDGYQDLLFGGDQMYLLRNDGRGRFVNASSILPPSLKNIIQAGAADQDSDGDLDLVVVDKDRTVRLLRNDGGNANRWLKVALSGLGTGSGKNNRNGIGAKIEIKAGELYEMRFVTEPVTHFGLGPHPTADVLRVVWTNGVPQNHIQPQSNQMLLEKQILKGSCPFVYAWNGKRFEFVTDIMWKSALGMPLGIMGGSTAYAFPNSSDEFLKIAGSQLKEKDGFYTIQITEELWETPYIDKSRLVVVDHPGNVDVFIDEKFVIPPFPPLRIHPVGKKIYPTSASDENGINVLSQIRAHDDVYISNLRAAKHQGITEEHGLILNLGDLDRRDQILLFLRGWIFPSDASINMALSQSPNATRAFPPYLQVPDKNGKWQTVIPSMSFPMGKDKTMIVDLTGKFLSDDHRVRIRTSMDIYWDEIFYTRNEPSTTIRLTTLKPASADLHYRGFSKMYRKNVLGPHWFDYANADPTPLWRDLEGNYTRFGDVTPLLQESDSKFVIFNAGDEITVHFDARQAPTLPSGWTRDFLLYSDGWIKDGDLNTAHSKTVDPLPFQGIQSYPYSPKDRYPTDASHQEYLKTYNTRVVKPNLKIPGKN